MRTARPVSTLVLTLVLGGCVVGPNYHTPPAPTVSGYTPEALDPRTALAETPGQPSQHLEPGADVPGQWWTLYHSPAINALVEQALKANPDLQSAQAALRVALEAYYSQRGSALPTVGASYTASPQQTASELASILSSNADLFTLHTAQVSVSYTPDVFGGVRRQTENARAQALAQRFQTEAAYLTLTSNVVVAAIQQASLQDQIDATTALIAADQQTLDQMRRQLAVGEISRADLTAQETAVAQAQQTLPPLRKQLAQQADLIADLTGRFPSQAPLQRLQLSDLTLPQALPVSLPSSLVRQRPDIRAADANLDAASALVGVAIANRLPNLTLTAVGGGETTNLGRLLTSGAQFWTLAGSATQPIFDGGDLLHKQRGAQAGLDQAKAQYQSTVLSAFQNVADSLQALQADTAALQAAAQADQTAQASLDLAKTQFTAGEVGGLNVLSAQQAYQQVHIAMIQAQAARYADTAALFQALGGGWWNRAATTEVR